MYVYQGYEVSTLTLEKSSLYALALARSRSKERELSSSSVACSLLSVSLSSDWPMVQNATFIAFTRNKCDVWKLLVEAAQFGLHFCDRSLLHELRENCEVCWTAEISEERLVPTYIYQEFMYLETPTADNMPRARTGPKRETTSDLRFEMVITFWIARMQPFLLLTCRSSLLAAAPSQKLRLFRSLCWYQLDQMAPR